MINRSNTIPGCQGSSFPLVSSTEPPFTPRRALDPSGRLGSFYDACCDQVLSPSNLQFTSVTISSSSSPQLYVKEYDPEKSTNILQWYKMHHDLQLSVALRMTSELGVGALINYHRPIDKYTRFVCCTYYAQTEYVPDHEFYRLRQNKTFTPIETTATHVIVLVNWGIDAVAILQLPHDDQRVPAIDQAIRKLCGSQRSNQRDDETSEDERILEQIEQIDVFSNIPELCQVKSITQFVYSIPQVSRKPKLLKPYNYNLCPIQTLYNTNSQKQGVFIELYPDDIEMIVNRLLDLVRTFDRFKAAMDQAYQIVKFCPEDRLSKMYAKWNELNQMYTNEIERLSKLVVNIRRGHTKREKISEVLNHDIHKKLLEYMRSFEDNLSAIQEKEDFIQTLLEKDVGYRDANKYGIQQGDDLETVKQKLLEDGEVDCFILFHDHLVKNKKVEWDELVNNTMKERAERRSLQIIVVDFTFCTYGLKNISVVRRNEKKMENTASSTIASTLKRTQERSANDGTINILLLGETGVGKSTFINAFANYLAFDTLQEAEPTPHALMHVSFLMTVGNDFEERIVKFGEEDDSKNEDYSQPGQSVTQHCKSYPFTVRDRENKERKLCLIDSPGIGNVRGLAQDEVNMQHILSYVSNLSHLNGVCILMKPTNTRMNIFFRSCLVQLMDFLGEGVRDKVMFCFTNARSTFYTPGNSGPLLKQLLKSLAGMDDLFQKRNTFCFDSESFRYLVARKNGITFDQLQEQDYQESWERSSKESKRLLQYIDSKLTFNE